MDEDLRLQARGFLLRCRLYRFMALCFAAMGVAVFSVLYFKQIDDHLLESLKNPATVLLVLLPFLPAFILTRMSAKAERKFMEVMERISR